MANLLIASQGLTQNTFSQSVNNTNKASGNVWIDFSDSSSITTVSGAVSQATNKAFSGANFTQGSSGNRPLYSLAVKNGLNVAQFDHSNDNLICNYGGSNLTDFSFMVAICSTTNRTDDGIVTHSTNTTGLITLEIVNNALAFWVYNVGRVALTSAGSFVINTWYILCVTYTSGAGKIYINNAVASTTNTASRALGTQNIGLGGGNAGFFGFGGYIGEFLLWPRVITDNERNLQYQAMQRWL